MDVRLWLSFSVALCWTGHLFIRQVYPAFALWQVGYTPDPSFLSPVPSPNHECRVSRVAGMDGSPIGSKYVSIEDIGGYVFRNGKCCSQDYTKWDKDINKTTEYWDVSATNGAQCCSSWSKIQSQPSPRPSKDWVTTRRWDQTLTKCSQDQSWLKTALYYNTSSALSAAWICWRWQWCQGCDNHAGVLKVFELLCGPTMTCIRGVTLGHTGIIVSPLVVGRKNIRDGMLKQSCYSICHLLCHSVFIICILKSKEFRKIPSVYFGCQACIHEKPKLTRTVLDEETVH